MQFRSLKNEENVTKQVINRTKSGIKHGEIIKKEKTIKNGSSSSNSHVKIKTSKLTFEQAEKRFTKYWALQRDLRVNYKKILNPCRFYMTWREHYPFKGPYTITSANNSYVTLDIQPAGQYSTITIETYTKKKTRKRIGGDSWRVHIQGAASVPVSIIDHNNGSYEASFLLTQVGLYTVDIYLDYSLCDGFKDPPPGWFIKGRGDKFAVSAAVS